MKLINLDEEIPNIFYVFVNLNKFITKNNYEGSKTFNSAVFGELYTNKQLLDKYLKGTINYLPYIPNPNSDLHVVSPFQSTITSNYQTEYNVEIARQYNFPLYPSRLSATYAFGDYDSCVRVSNLYRWDC